MAYKISEFMIGIIIASGCVAIFGLLIYQLGSRYSGITYDNSTIGSYNALSQMTPIVEEVKNATDISEKPNIFDIVGNFFSQGYRALRITKKSYDAFGSMTDQAVKDSGLAEAGAVFRTMVTLIVILIIFLVIILKAIIKSDV
jgi:hypothetical protein